MLVHKIIMNSRAGLLLGIAHDRCSRHNHRRQGRRGRRRRRGPFHEETEVCVYLFLGGNSSFTFSWDGRGRTDSNEDLAGII